MGESQAGGNLGAYERLAELTARMREAAMREEWDEVVALESECHALYGRLAERDDGAGRGAEYQHRKAELICKVLEDDARIRELLSGELTRIWRLMDGSQTVNRLSATYGGGAG